MSRTETARLRIALKRHRRGPGRRTRYPLSLQRTVARHARERLGAGERLVAIAGSLGLALASLQRWIGSDRAVPLRAVRVEDLPDRRAPGGVPASHPVLVMPGGVRVEGLDLGQIATLLRSLS